jgi:precorrin-8X/cobalt-precorrin-8 methylmutase
MTASHTSPALDRTGLVDAGRSIETESFAIIDSEMGDHGLPPEQWQVVRRVIHTTADFEYASLMRFHPRAIQEGMAALRGGATLFTDTRMIQVGLSPWRLEWFGNRVETPPADPESQKWAEELQTTRSVAAFRHAPERLQGGIIAVGNAPTALLETVRLIREEGIRPALVIGAPVGFVRAAESKEALWELQEQPSIVVSGRKGGSTVALAVLHALLELARPT